MARKKGISGRVLGGVIGAGVILVVVVPVLFFVFGFGNDDIITTTTDEEIIEDGINQGFLTVPIQCFEITTCKEGQPLISDEIDTNPLEELIDPKPLVGDSIEPEIESVIIDEKEIPIEEIIDPPPNLIEPPIVEIISDIIKIDNSGERFTSSTSINLPLFGLFVEDTTNKNFDQGFIENKLFLKTDPNLNIELNGFFDILIGNETILNMPVPINVQGITREDGILLINFISPTGLASSEPFLFQFNDHIDKFPIQGLTRVEYVLSSVVVNINEFNYGIDSEIIFQMDIFTDPNIILITNEEGGLIKVFPTDDNVKLCSSAGKFCWKSCTQRSVRFGCLKYKTVCSIIATAPTIGAWDFLKLDKTSGVFTTVTSGSSFSTSCPLNEIVQRDEVYKLKISNPNGATITWKTEPEQRNFIFSCVSVQSVFTGILTTTCNYNSDAFLGGLLPP